MTPQDGAQVEGAAIQELSLGNTPYALSRQKLNEIINMLRDCGTEGIIKLPKIAVIGNQSAGKSSLIEAISQIKLPRASGTCTRCPMEVILRRSSEKWRAKVSLRFDHNDPRAKKKSEPNPFAETDNPKEITLFLRRAQLAILNPGKSVEEFKYLDDAQCGKCDIAQKFSQSTVVLEITGADVDVTFIDLPGIISNTEKVCIYFPNFTYFLDRGESFDRIDQRSGHLIRVPGGMPDSSYHFHERFSHFLAPLTASDDIDNQSAAKIAKEYDPNGLRTIGIPFIFKYLLKVYSRKRILFRKEISDNGQKFFGTNLISFDVATMSPACRGPIQRRWVKVGTRLEMLSVDFSVTNHGQSLEVVWESRDLPKPLAMRSHK